MENLRESKNDIQMLYDLTKIQNNRQPSKKDRSNKYSWDGKTSIDIWPSHMLRISIKSKQYQG